MGVLRNSLDAVCTSIVIPRKGSMAQSGIGLYTTVLPPTPPPPTPPPPPPTPPSPTSPPPPPPPTPPPPTPPLFKGRWNGRVAIA